MKLPPGQGNRIAAHLLWASLGPAKVTGLKRRLSALEQPQREAVGRYLIALASTAGTVGPAQITVLTRAYQALGIEPSELYSARPSG